MATESPDLSSFLRLARSVDGDGILALTPDRQGVVTRTGRFARWISQFRRGENRELSRRFVNALTQEYGAELTREVTQTPRLARTLERGKPLKARQVRRADLHATALKNVHNHHNLRLARALTDTGHGTRKSPLKTAISDAAPRLYPHDPTVVRIVDYGKVANAARDAIVVEAGREGALRLTGERAKEIVAGVVDREVTAAYRASEARAMEALDPQRPGSIAHTVLAEKLAGLNPPLNLEENGLTPDAADSCRKRFETALGTSGISVVEFDHEPALCILADEILTPFVRERAAARARVDELHSLDDEERSALRAQATRDVVPAALAGSLGRAYPEIKEDVRALAAPLPPVKLQRSLSRLRDAISNALRESRAMITVENQDRMHRSAWRLLLAPAGEAQAKAMLQQIESDESLLRGLGEAVIWYREIFPGTDEWDRTFKNVGDALDGKPIYENESRQTATHYAVLLRTLHDVLAENAGTTQDAAHVLGANGNPDDRAVTIARNLGIPFPAPDRLGWGNDDVPISDDARARINAALDRHVETAGRARHRSGLVTECADFLRASDRVSHEKRDRLRPRFIVDGELVEAGAEAVTARLREFCTDENRQLNKEMLTGISLVANQAPFRCVYSGCMNPDRPDLAMMNGYPRGVFLGHTFSLWNNAPNDVRLQVSEQIKPLYFHPVDQHTILPEPGDRDNNDAHPGNPVMLSDESDFQTLIEIGFDRDTWQPELKDLWISYNLVEGMPSTRWFIRHPELGSRSGAGDRPEPGSGVAEA